MLNSLFDFRSPSPRVAPITPALIRGISIRWPGATNYLPRPRRRRLRARRRILRTVATPPQPRGPRCLEVARCNSPILLCDCAKKGYKLTSRCLAGKISPHEIGFQETRTRYDVSLLLIRLAARAAGGMGGGSTIRLVETGRASTGERGPAKNFLCKSMAETNLANTFRIPQEPQSFILFGSC